MFWDCLSVWQQGYKDFKWQGTNRQVSVGKRLTQNSEEGGFKLGITDTALVLIDMLILLILWDAFCGCKSRFNITYNPEVCPPI